MERVGHVWRVKPGRAMEYDRRHAAIWPELDALLRASGVRRYTIYRWGEIVFSHMEVEDYVELIARFGSDPVAQRWEQEFSEILDYPNVDPETGWPERLHEVWDLGRADRPVGGIRPGLVSVTYRALDPADIVALSAHEELGGIEWGGDVHVPHGDLGTARRVGALTLDAGLEVAAYGSYYRTGPPEGRGPEFEAVLETAVALGAPIIRVWAGDRDPSESTGAHRRAIEDDTRRIADLAATARITVAFEFHRGTLTGTAESARRLLSRVDHPHVRSLWQPPEGADDEECLAGLDAVLPWLANLHVFHWWPDAEHRRPLDEGAPRWHRFIDLAATDDRDRFALLEFVEGDDPGVLAREARTLRAWLDRS